MRMRTIREAFEYITAQDPETALTQTALRRLVKTGAIPSVNIGSKNLIALEAIEDYLQGRQTPAVAAPEVRGIIRPVEVRR